MQDILSKGLTITDATRVRLRMNPKAINDEQIGR
jgi:hypothetical protein